MASCGDLTYVACEVRRRTLKAVGLYWLVPRATRNTLRNNRVARADETERVILYACSFALSAKEGGRTVLLLS